VLGRRQVEEEETASRKGGEDEQWAESERGERSILPGETKKNNNERRGRRGICTSAPYLQTTMEVVCGKGDDRE